MEAVPRLRTELDPLVAEAKQRMRRRRFALAAAVLAAVALAVGVSLALRPANSGGVSRDAANSSQLPRLQDAFALGTFVRLDHSSTVAVFRIKCGWHYSPRRKLRPGLWKLSLRGLTFDLYGGYTPGHYASGSGRPVTLREWERTAARVGWAGSLRVGFRSGWLSNGPTTDICGGVSG